MPPAISLRSKGASTGRLTTTPGGLLPQSSGSPTLSECGKSSLLPADPILSKFPRPLALRIYLSVSRALRDLHLIPKLISKPGMAEIALGNINRLLFQLCRTASDQHAGAGSDLGIAGRGPSIDVISQLIASSWSSPSSWSQHFCLAGPSQLHVEAWEKHVTTHGVKVMETTDWELGGGTECVL